MPVSRIVLDLDGAVDMLNKMNSLQTALQNSGVITTQSAAPAAKAGSGKSKS